MNGPASVSTSAARGPCGSGVAVWVDVADGEAVDDRFARFEGLDPTETAKLLTRGVSA
jgi:hypothetical protein